MADAVRLPRLWRFGLWTSYCLGVFILVWSHIASRQQGFSDLEGIAEMVRQAGDDLSRSILYDTTMAQRLDAVRNFGPDLVWPFPSAQDVKAYLIHVGKAGGTSVQYRLFIFDAIPLLPCRMNHTHDLDQQEECLAEKSQSILKTRFFASFHTFASRYTAEQKQWLRNHTNLLVYTVRDPSK